jgi:beta-ketoacyl-acyl-carrier-protein synthase III
MEKVLNTVITGSGSYLPEKVIKNDYFMDAEFYDEKNERIPRSNEEIIEKFRELVGITERRYAEDHIVNSDMAAIAGSRAVEAWGGDKENLDYVIVAHNYGDVRHGVFASEMVPSMAARVKHKMGIKNNKCIPYDMIFGCPGWVQGVILAHQLLQARQAKNILVVGSDTLSRIYDPCDRDSMIFADGAGAVVLSAVEDNKKYGVLSTANVSDCGDEIDYLKGGPSLNPEYTERPTMIRMAGRKVYEYVLRNVPAAIKSALDAAELSLSQVSKLIIHQANEKMDEAVFIRLKRLYKDCKAESRDFMPMSLPFLGNSSVATVPTLFDLVSRGKMEGHVFNPSDNIILASVGAGMNINTVVYRFPDEM